MAFKKNKNIKRKTDNNNKTENKNQSNANKKNENFNEKRKRYAKEFPITSDYLDALKNIIEEFLNNLPSDIEALVVDFANIIFAACKGVANIGVANNILYNFKNIGRICRDISKIINDIKLENIKCVIFSIIQLKTVEPTPLKNTDGIINSFNSNKSENDVDLQFNVQFNVCYNESGILLRENCSGLRKKYAVRKLSGSPDDAIVFHLTRLIKNSFALTYDNYKDWVALLTKNQKFGRLVLNDIIVKLTVTCHQWNTEYTKYNSRNIINNINNKTYTIKKSKNIGSNIKPKKTKNFKNSRIIKNNNVNNNTKSRTIKKK